MSDIPIATEPSNEGSELPLGRAEVLGQAREQGEKALADALRHWRDEVRIRSNAQQIAAAEDERNSLLLGVAVTVLAALGASGILTASASPFLAALAGIMTLVAAILAGVQTVVRFGERSGAHRGAAASFGRVKTRLDLLLARGEPTPDELNDLSVVMERLDTETPIVAERFWKAAVARIQSGLVW